MNNTEYIESLDFWMTKEVKLDEVTNLSELGFKHLNDILLYKHFPEYRNNLELIKEGSDDARINEYGSLTAYEWFKNFTVLTFNQIVEAFLKNLPSINSVSSIDKIHTDLLFQNLIIIALSVERWGQLISKNKPGTSVRAIHINDSALTLHEYLKSKLSHYNTLASFALSFTSGVNGMYFPIINNGSVEHGERIEYKSAYYNYKPNLTRFPSILSMDSFLVFMKKCEIISYGYNAAFFELIQRLNLHPLDDTLAIQKVKEITYLFRTATSCFLEFMKDPQFNEAKFMLIIRQLTVEVDISPSMIIFENIYLNRQEKIRVKGLVDHYLLKTCMNSDERLLFIQQLLTNEGIQDSQIASYIRQSIYQTGIFDKTDFENFFCNYNISVDKGIFTSCLSELITENQIGPYRLKYSLTLLKIKMPFLKSVVDEKINDSVWLNKTIAIVRQSEYNLAPSGANSVAFYGPDVMLGYSENIPNYTIHMLNRLEVMTPDDQKRFWNFDKFRQSNLSVIIRKKLSLLLGISETNFLEKASDIEITKWLTIYPYIRLYIDLFDSYFTLAKTHNASIERFIRRVDKKMPVEEKEKLINSPEHGTTYMRPTSDSESILKAVSLPTLDNMTRVRGQHLFNEWIKPFRTLKQNSSVDSIKNMVESMDNRQCQSLFF